MHPIMRIVLPVIGALIGASLGHPATRTFDILIGAIAGFAVADLGIIRARLDGLAAQVDRLTAELRRRREVPDPPTEHPESVSEPQGSASPSPGIPVASPVIPASRPQERSELPIVSAIRGFLTGGNALVRAGVIILFFGVAFLLRYMAEHTHVPIEFRLTGIALGGLALLMFGWRVRTTRSGYAFALQGGGVGILYLTVFAALRLYSILPAAIAFPILATIAIISAALAVMQNSISFALLAVIGGFLAPVLASTGQGSHIVLFSYYLVLNAGILAVAWFKA